MNTLIKERNNDSEISIRIKINRVTQHKKVYLANEQSCLAFGSTDLGYIFGGDIRNDLEILMRGKGS